VLDTSRDVKTLLGDTINKVRRGELDPRIANTVGYLAAILIRAIDVTELEQRVAQLEAAATPRNALRGGAFDLPLFTEDDTCKEA